MGDSAQLVDQASMQDALRPVRLFVSALNGALNDQSFAGTDYVATNPPSQYTTQTNAGVSVEGKPALIAAPGQRHLSPRVMWIALGIAALIYLKH